MPTQTISKPKALLWGPRDHLPRLARACTDAGWTVVAVGAPPARGASPEPDDALAETPHFDDARQAITDAEADVALFLDPSPLDEPGIVKLCAHHELTPLCLAPADTSNTNAPRVLPLLADAVVHASALEALEPVGPVQGLALRMSAPAHLGGLPARLYDAMHLVLKHLGIPEQIHASCTNATREGDPSPRQLAGTLHAHLRAPGYAATLAIDARVNILARDALFMCETATLRLTDGGFVVVAHDGAPTDKGEGAGVDPLVEQLKRVTDPRLPAPAPYEHAEVLALCDAIALSVRTGQPESPHELLQIRGG
mgnify:CR=1 FL=1